MKDITGIYKITNKVNNKVYIGQSIHVLSRWGQHQRNAFNPNTHTYNYPLYRAIRKYGVENFQFEVLEEVSSIELLTEEEQYFIDKYKSLDPNYGYNIVPAVDSKKGENCNWAKLTDREEELIFQLIADTNMSFKDIGQMFHVSGSCIEDINKGRRRRKPNKKYPIREAAKSVSHRGEKQNGAILTEKDVMEIRNRYVNETLEEIYEDYKDRMSYSGFKNVCYGVTWKHLPCYKKREKKWIYCNK